MLKKIIAEIWSKRTAREYERIRKNAVKDQQKWLYRLIREGRKTDFGTDYRFDKIHTYKQFKEQVPVLQYEDIKHYIDRIIEGKENVLWPGRPLYFAKTSGTTSGTKYIPISKASMPYHIKAARDMLLLYINVSGNKDFLDGKMIFLQGSPELEQKGGIPTGRLSGIAAHFVPGYLQRNRLPSWETNIIKDWETKLARIVDETLNEKMTLISGIPSWLQTYFEKLIEAAGKPVGEIFPYFSLFVHGGVNFEPYRAKFDKLIGRPVDTLETYPASEGFIAFQDDYRSGDLLLLTDHGIFYEFIPLDDLNGSEPQRLTLAEVETGVDYAVILNTNAGLWGYMIGDIIRFTSVNPYKIKVSGRVKHFISAFGEHVIGKEVEQALKTAAEKAQVEVNEFSVAPQVNPPEGLPYHEWLVEFDSEPENPEQFARDLDEEMQRQNIYYKDLIDGKILRPAVVSMVKKGGFHRYMASVGKLGGQNKIPALKNDRSIADRLHQNGEIIKQIL
jgi:hypothetical protein